MNSLTVEMTLHVTICSILYRSVSFGQRLSYSVLLMNASKSVCPSLALIYVNQAFQL